jgi:Phytanoyl-CoA dioxygenase (PhyH)
VSWEFAGDARPGEVREAFRLYGFALIRGVLTAAEVAQVRAELDRQYASPQLRELPVMCASEMLKHEALWRCVFKERVVGSLAAALGPQLCYQGDLDVQRNSYGQGSLEPHRGWHMDAGSENRQAYLRSAQYRFAKCGIFLQDFDSGWGGGIMVKPKSHRRFFEPNPVKRLYFGARRVRDRLAIRRGSDSGTLKVPLRAGDLCFFDSRLLHSSVLPEPHNIRSIGYDRRAQISSFWPDVPAAHTKYVIYWDACNQAMVQDFLENSVKRSAGEVLGMQEEPCRPATYTRVLARSFPEDYPAAFVTAARECRIGIASLAPQSAALYKQKLQSMRLLHA